MERLRATTSLAIGLLLGIGSLAASGPASAGDPGPCRVRNTFGYGGVEDSFERAVAKAGDGWHLLVRGSCLVRSVRIRSDLTIEGVGDPRPMLDARHWRRVLLVSRGATVTIRHLVITGGRTIGSPSREGGGYLTGGGIRNLGTLSLIDSVVRGNRATHQGGGIYNRGTLTIDGSVVRGNTSARGGGITNGGAATLTGSVVRSNTAAVGGGIENMAVMVLADSVVRDNSATASDGGGVQSHGYDAELTLYHTRVLGNSADRDGGGIQYFGSLALRRASSVTSNTAGGHGGGIDALYVGDGEVPNAFVKSADSTVSGNDPDDCHGFDADPC